MVGILAGSAINLPVRRLVRTEEVLVHPFAMFGLSQWWSQRQRLQGEPVIAVNVGGCVVPTLLEMQHASRGAGEKD